MPHTRFNCRVLPGTFGFWSLLAAVLMASPVAAADKLNPKANSDPLYVQLRSLGLSGEACRVEGLSLNRDRATFIFTRGDFHFLAPVDGRITGAVFLGDGEFEMKPYPEAEQRHLRLLTGEPYIKEAFNKMVLRFTDDTYAAIKQERTTTTGPVHSGARDLLENFRKKIRRGSLRSLNNLDARVLTDLTWLGQRGFFRAYFEGRRFGEMTFELDPLGVPEVTPEEICLTAYSESNHGTWVATHLKEHYDSRSVSDESHAFFDLEHHKVVAEAKGKRLDAVVQTRLKAMADGVRVLPFDLFGRLRVRKVSDGQGRELAFIQEDKEEDPALSVLLAEALKKGDELVLQFEYGGDEAISDSGGGNYTLETRTNWYPNSRFGDRATYEMTLKVPKGLTMVATGLPMGDSQENNMLVSHWKSDVPLTVAGFNFGKFKKISSQDDKLNYLIEAYANRDIPDYLKAVGDGDAILGSLNTVSMMEKAKIEAQAALAIYTQMFGALPYGRIAMTQQPDSSFGQSWPMLVYMPLIAFLDSTHRHALGQDATKFVQYVGPHEVAHQWWGHLIGWKSYRDQWISEGFSEFSASLFAQAAYKQGQFVDFWRRQREMMFAKNQFGYRPSEVGGVTMGYRLDTGKTGTISRYIMYPKGGLILHMLRMLMWEPKSRDARFSAMMQEFIKTHYNQDVSTEDFQRVVEKHLCPELDLENNGKVDWFFRQFVYGTTTPEYQLDSRMEAADEGKVKLSFKVTQSKVDDGFVMRVPIYLDFGGNLTRLGTIKMTGNTTSQEQVVMLPKKPRRVLLNGLEDVICIQ
ncbi:MAG: M1 family aminopeptidase [Acidobacteriota bacterium]